MLNLLFKALTGLLLTAPAAAFEFSGPVSDGSVTTAKIGSGAVTTPKLANDAVVAAAIMNTSVTTAKIGDGAVITSKLGQDSVTSSAILSGAVTTSKILDGAVTTNKYSGPLSCSGANCTLTGVTTFDGNTAGPDFSYDGAIGARFLTRASQSIGAGGTVSANACGGVKDITSAGDVTTSLSNTFSTPGANNDGCIMHVCNRGSFNITLDSNGNFVSDADIVLTPNDCVDVESNGTTWIENAASALLDGVVTTGKIASGAVTSAKIIDGGVTTDKIGDGAITTAKIGVAAVTTAKLNGGDGGATIDFGALAANACTDSGTTISVPGARQGNPVSIGATDNLASIAGIALVGRVSSNDTVTVRACCVTVGACSVDAPAAQVNVRVAFQ